MTTTNNTRILDWQPDRQPYFEQLNKTWIEKYFSLEPLDHDILGHPQEHIIDRGGDIIFVETEDHIAGTVAYKKVDDETVEMTKMGVDEAFQGRKLGWMLAVAILQRATEAGFKRMILYSSRKLTPALKMYEKLGFREVELEKGGYERCDIKMEIPLYPNPWQTLSSQVHYENPWIRLTEHQVINPSGGKGIYGVVHFKNIAIGVVALDAAGDIYLVGQYRYPLGHFSWEIPEGGGPHDKDPLLSAQRELLEETGLRAAKWTPIVRMHLSNSVSDEHGIVYLAQELEQGDAEPEETEQLFIQKIPFEKAYQMVKNHEITDSLSVAAIQKIRLMMLEGEL